MRSRIKLDTREPGDKPMEDPQFAGTNCLFLFLFRAKENRFACRWTRHQTCSPRTNPPTTPQEEEPLTNSNSYPRERTRDSRTLEFDSAGGPQEVSIRRISSSQSEERSTSRSASRSKGRKSRIRTYKSSSEATDSSSSDDDSLAKPKRMLKPPKFDGQTSFETFWAQFTNCAEYNGWSKAQKLTYLKSSLNKDVANILWVYNKDVTDSLSELTKVLESQFGGRSFTDKHRIELRNRRRRPGESISNLHVDIRRLAALALPEVEHSVRNYRM